MSAELSTTRKTTIIASTTSRLLKIERGDYQLKTIPILQVETTRPDIFRGNTWVNMSQYLTKKLVALVSSQTW